MIYLEKIRHVDKVSVLLCKNVSCRGGEEGCNGSECKGFKWRKYSHKQFVNWFDRCPRGCNKNVAME